MVYPDFPIPKGYAWQYHFLVWLQSFHNTFFDAVAKILTQVGVEGFYLIALPVLFWSVHRKIGIRLAYAFVGSMYVNAWLKDFLHILRPMGIPGIHSVFDPSATGFAMPSAHVQGTTTFWLMVQFWLRKLWLWPLVLVLLIGVGVSRLYSGVHWPLDVLVGWGIGLVFALAGWWLGGWWSYRQYAFRIRMAFAVLLPVVLLVLQRDAASALYATVLLGVGVGAVLEQRWLDVDLDGVWWKRVSTAIIGIACLIAVQWITKGLNLTPLRLVDIAEIRGLLIGLWTTLGAPYVFLLGGLYVKRATD